MDIISQCRRLLYWGEEGRKLFTFLRSVCLNSSLALDAEKKPFEWKFSEKRAVVQLRNVAVAALRKNSKSKPHKAKLMFTAC